MSELGSRFQGIGMWQAGEDLPQARPGRFANRAYRDGGGRRDCRMVYGGRASPPNWVPAFAGMMSLGAGVKNWPASTSAALYLRSPGYPLRSRDRRSVDIVRRYSTAVTARP